MALPEAGPTIRTVQVKTALVRSRLFPYCVNPYAGCAHGCVYCYARFATRSSHAGEAWGAYVDVRVNAAEVLERQLGRATPGIVYMSSVCDARQPAEETYGVTRRCLQLLVDSGFPLFFQTKSALIERDLGLLEGCKDVTLGITLTSVDDRIARLFEPGASSPAERLRVLRLARERGLRTFVFLGPLLPDITDRGEGLRELFSRVAAVSPDFLLVDRLNRRTGMWNDTRVAAEVCAPDLVAGFRHVLFDGDPVYESGLRSRVQLAADASGLGDRIEWCF